MNSCPFDYEKFILTSRPERCIIFVNLGIVFAVTLLPKILLLCRRISLGVGATTTVNAALPLEVY